MASKMFITGEWGSVAMKLDLCRDDGDGVRMLETVTGGGVIGCADPEAAFFTAAGPWFDTHGAMPAILAGMIGSNIGWRDSGYVACPADATAVAGAVTRLTARGIDIHFTPGLKCRNIFGLPDVIRGEEMQVLGWLAGASDGDERLICLPGRHTKWLLSEGRRIAGFFTGMTGELEDLLLTHGLLGKGVTRNVKNNDAFTAGVDLMAADPTLSMGHALFATRSRLVLGDHSADAASSFLAGVLVGADVRDSVKAHETRGLATSPVAILGHGDMAERYGKAFARLGLAARPVDTTGLAARGLAAVLAAAHHSAGAVF